MKEDLIYLLGLKDAKYIAEKELEKNPCAANAQKVFEYSKRIDEVLEKIDKDYDELNKYKDLQQELGCPLEVREQAFNNGFYDVDGNHYFCEHYVPYLKSMHTRGISIGRERHFNLKDYKKTWWLIKE